MALVDKGNWREAADLLSRAIHGQMARLEVADIAMGDQVYAEWAPLEGLSYDPKDDLFEIQLEGLDHLVFHPNVFAISEHDGLADSLAVVDGRGAQHIVKLREPIALPPTPGAPPAG